MPQFNNKEEYEQWKAQRLRALQEAKESGNTPADHPEIPPQDERTPDIPPEQKTAHGEISALSDLFREAWETYKRRLGTLIALYLLSFLFFALAFGVFFGFGFLVSLLLGESKAVIVAGAITGALAGMLVMTWGIAAVAYAVVDEQIGIKDSLGKAWDKVGAFLWFFSVFGYLITGGFLLFFFPGVIFLVWFSFGQFILAAEGQKGMDALLKSKEYVRGQWFDVFARLFVIYALSGLIGAVPFVGPLLSLLFAPFMMIFLFLIYRDLRGLKTDVPFAYSSAEKWKWLGVATLGYLVLPVFILVLMGAALTIPLIYLLHSLR
jgi:hypothetical protein